MVFFGGVCTAICSMGLEQGVPVKELGVGQCPIVGLVCWTRPNSGIVHCLYFGTKSTKSILTLRVTNKELYPNWVCTLVVLPKLPLPAPPLLVDQVQLHISHWTGLWSGIHRIRSDCVATEWESVS